MHILVTGASGMLGTALIMELLAKGHTVRALIRDADKLRTQLPDHAPFLETVQGDVTDRTIWDQALPDVDGVVHAAAYFREYYEPRADISLLRRTNVEAVHDLLQAAQRHRVETIVHISSTTVLAPGSIAYPANEHAPDNPDRTNLYRTSKIDAQRVIRDYLAREGAVRVPMILPAWMWGPRDAGPTSAGRLYNAIADGRMLAIPNAGNHVVDARDVAAAAVTALERGRSGARYLMAGHWTSLPDLTMLIAHAENVPAPRVIPAALAMTLAAGIESVARIRHSAPNTTRRAVRTLLQGHHDRIDSSASLTELGTTFRPVQTTIADIAAEHLAPDGRR